MKILKGLDGLESPIKDLSLGFALLGFFSVVAAIVTWLVSQDPQIIFWYGFVRFLFGLVVFALLSLSLKQPKLALWLMLITIICHSIVFDFFVRINIEQRDVRKSGVGFVIFVIIYIYLWGVHHLTPSKDLLNEEKKHDENQNANSKENKIIN